MSTEPLPSPSFDALLPPEMARKAEELGVFKVQMTATRTLALAVLAGAFIALGANFSAVVSTGGADMPWGWTRLLSGLAFSLGLGLVVVGGAELFTGNNLVVMAWASGRVRAVQVLRNWALVFVGNTVGALSTAGLVYLSGQHRFARSELGRTALDIARHKVSLPLLDAFFLGILCNVLVCLAIWMSMSARSTVDRLAVLTLPVAAFVAGGFEHSIANLYILPLGMAIHRLAPAEFWTQLGRPRGEYDMLTVTGMLGNLGAVTAGNIVGGAVLVGLVYWAVYLRRAEVE
jgi:formate transporter